MEIHFRFHSRSKNWNHVAFKKNTRTVKRCEYYYMFLKTEIVISGKLSVLDYNILMMKKFTVEEIWFLAKINRKKEMEMKIKIVLQSKTFASATTDTFNV